MSAEACVPRCRRKRSLRYALFSRRQVVLLAQFGRVPPRVKGPVQLRQLDHLPEVLTLAARTASPATAE